MRTREEELERIRAACARRIESLVGLAADICRIPAPTGAERQRAEFVASLFRDRGYDIEMDAVGNVYARRPGLRPEPVLMLLAHIDTVFPSGTPIDVRRVDTVLYGPGIGDNAVNVAAMLSAFDVLDDLGYQTAVDIVAVADVGEEGLGNLRGARAAVERFRRHLGAVIVLDGRQGRITNAAVGSLRWRVTLRGPGGHSFAAFGTPSAIHGLGRVIAAITELDVPSEPKTTYNVGIIEGGVSVNTIAPEASAIIDMRSTSEPELRKLAARIADIIARVPGSGLVAEVEELGERPAGARDRTDPLVRLAAETLAWLGYAPEFHAASTDANVPMSLGIPTVCVGVAHGDRMHTVEEYIEIPRVEDGLAQVVRLCIEAAQLVADGTIAVSQET